MTAAVSEAQRLAVLPPETRAEVLDGLSDRQLLELVYDWKFWRRPSQRFPGEDLDGIVTGLLQGGRGSGKTRPGAEEVNARVSRGEWGRVALVGPTAADVRDVMVEGESGIKACSPPWFWPHYEPSKRRVTWPNGAMAFAYSAEEPDRLRGPQHHGAWADEIGAWRRGKQAWDMLMFGLRLGDNPQVIATTTPRSLVWLRELVRDPSTAVSRMSTYENRANLADVYMRVILARYEGTRLAAQEIEGILLDDVEGALWTSALLERERLATVHPDSGLLIPAPAFDRIVVGVDPPGGTITECGIVVAGRHQLEPRATADQRLRREATVIDDVSLAGPPEVWAKEVVKAYYRHNADAIVAERNFGEQMVRAVIHNVDPAVKVEMVRASESKRARAEPVAVLWDQGRGHLYGYFGELESELTSWVPPGTVNEAGEDIGTEESPNRLDAMVWAFSELVPPAGTQLGGLQNPAKRGGASWT